MGPNAFWIEIAEYGVPQDSSSKTAARSGWSITIKLQCGVESKPACNPIWVDERRDCKRWHDAVNGIKVLDWLY